ncbi:EF-P beta-lysylation protein EpmB [Thiolapillus brandeum]|nr:EF-P beta-lysylation protein EpmB [Thiolapillus brandeum]
MKTDHWQQQLAGAFNCVEDLLSFLDLKACQEPGMAAADNDFSIRVTHFFASLMEKGNIDDPLLRQVLPLGAEMENTPGFSTDPLSDQSAHTGYGMLHKYHGRVLLITTGACAINCRYCFRRHFPYADNQVTPSQWQSLVGQLHRDRTVSEVILSGGDPLSLANGRLHTLIEDLQDIPHLRRLRIHSRLPVVLPDRLDSTLLDILADCRLSASLVLHINHPREISTELTQALLPLRHLGIPLLNQAVLLKGINDRAHIQIALSEELFEAGILPYYLHQLDLVRGAAHFAVDDQEAAALYTLMQARLPGYLLPRLVREIPGAQSKTTLPVSQNR